MVEGEYLFQHTHSFFLCVNPQIERNLGMPLDGDRGSG